MFISEFIKRLQFYNSDEYISYIQKLRNEKGLTTEEVKDLIEFENKNKKYLRNKH